MREDFIGNKEECEQTLKQVINTYGCQAGLLGQDLLESAARKDRLLEKFSKY
jgi:hypothetical protein